MAKLQHRTVCYALAPMCYLLHRGSSVGAVLFMRRSNVHQGGRAHTIGREVGIPVLSNREGSGEKYNQLMGDCEEPWVPLWCTVVYF